jgi:hypothetical protein
MQILDVSNISAFRPDSQEILIGGIWIKLSPDSFNRAKINYYSLCEE